MTNILEFREIYQSRDEIFRSFGQNVKLLRGPTPDAPRDARFGHGLGCYMRISHDEEADAALRFSGVDEEDAST